MSIVNTALACDSKKMGQYLELLQKEYPFLQVETIGHSRFGTAIPAIRLGDQDRCSLCAGGFHGTEWITSLLLLKYVEFFCHCKAHSIRWRGYDMEYLFSTRCQWIVPMVNPDGVDLSLLRIPSQHHESIVQMCHYSDLPQRWQSNGAGVDLNHNYNARWQQGKELEEQLGITGPGPTRYGGPQPESEPETQAMVALTRRLAPSMVLAFHSQGEVIYQGGPGSAQALGQVFAKVTSYQKEEPQGIAACRGYKDWFVEEFSRPGFTIEVGKGKNPLPLSQFDSIFMKNLELLLLAGVLS